jgi:hypothetical protein
MDSKNEYLRTVLGNVQKSLAQFQKKPALAYSTVPVRVKPEPQEVKVKQEPQEPPVVVIPEMFRPRTHLKLESEVEHDFSSKPTKPAVSKKVVSGKQNPKDVRLAMFTPKLRKLITKMAFEHLDPTCTAKVDVKLLEAICDHLKYMVQYFPTGESRETEMFIAIRGQADYDAEIEQEQKAEALAEDLESSSEEGSGSDSDDGGKSDRDFIASDDDEDIERFNRLRKKQLRLTKKKATKRQRPRIEHASETEDSEEQPPSPPPPPKKKIKKQRRRLAKKCSEDEDEQPPPLSPAVVPLPAEVVVECSLEDDLVKQEENDIENQDEILGTNVEEQD